jgi:predicted nucleotidyltransferase
VDVQSTIKDILEKIQKYLLERFQGNLKCLILYGSWVKGTAKSGSDIDLVAVFGKVDRDTEKSIYDMVRSIDTERNITIIPTSLEDFQKEKLPIYTAVKREGKLLYGNVDLSINPKPPEVKYSEFFERSRKFESMKVKIAEELLEKNLTTGIAELCFVASKHAIQAALAMKGEGYSSKISTLLPLTEKYLGREIASVFRSLVELYIKTEYGMQFLTDDELRLAIKCAKEIQRVYIAENPGVDNYCLKSRETEIRKPVKTKNS